MPTAREAPKAAPADTPRDVIAAFERASAALGRARAGLRGVVFGQDAAVELALAAVVAGGHALVAGAPGVSKTRLIQALGRSLGLSVGRLAFSPDLTLEDLVGDGGEGRREVDASGRLRPRGGPVFRQLLLAETLDQAAPRVRAALIDALHDGILHRGPNPHSLPRPFHVFATGGENAAADLSETEADRFLVQIDMGWPDRSGERRMLIETTDDAPLDIARALDPADLLEAQRTAVELPVGEKVVQLILELVRRARPDDKSAPALVRESVLRGPGPRAGQALMRLARARALIDARPAPSQADVFSLALAVLKPRLALAPAGRTGPTAETVVEALVRSL
jgi:MoxR-like ATPase